MKISTLAFPGATHGELPSGWIVIYYDGADTVTALAFAKLDDVLDFVKTTSKL